MGRKRNFINEATASLNVTFSESEIGKLNERFTIYTTSVMTHQQIANSFHFKKEVIEKAMYQLSLLPVVGYFDGEDFEGHETGYTKPYGCVIPNSARFEEIDGQEYLVVDCAMWSSRYPEVKDLSKQNQSMELVGISGTYNKEDKFYEVSEFSFDSLCILGENVKPAYSKARMDIDSNFTDEFEEFKSQLLEFFEEYTNNTNKKGESEDVDNLENQETVFKESGQHTHNTDIDWGNNQGQNIEFEVSNHEHNVKFPEHGFEEETVSFKLSHEATRDRIFKALNPVDEEGYRSFNYWIAETKDGSFVAQSMTDGLFYRFDYSETDGKIEINMESQVEAFATFMTQAEMNKLDELKANGEKFEEVNNSFAELSEKFATLTSEMEVKDAKIAELEQFKADKEKEELEKFQAEEQAKIQEIKAKFSSKLSAEEIENAVTSEMSSDEMNKALAVVFAQKMLAEETPMTPVFADISDNQPKIVTNEDRLVEEAKALRNKNIK